MTAPAGHLIEWTYATHGVQPEVRCEAGADAWCRTRPDADPGCQCEEFKPLRDEQGWFHRVTTYDALDRPVETEEVHRHGPSDECLVVVSMNADPWVTIETGPHAETFIIGTHPIDATWDGDGYDWTPRKADTLAAWLYGRFAGPAPKDGAWKDLDEGDRAYWEHEAAAVRRAVARGGFRPTAEDT